MEILNQGSPLLPDEVSPLEYWNDGRKRFNSIFPAVDRGVNNWMSDYYSNRTRNKGLAIVAHANSKMIDSSIVAQNAMQEEDKDVAEFLKDVVEFTKRKENFDEKFFWAIITAVAEGNVILTDQYGPMGNFGKGHKQKNGAFTLIVPNEEFLRYDPYLIDLQEQEWVIWRRKMTIGRAKKYFGHYDNFKDVIPGDSSRWMYDFTEFRSYDSFAELAENEVEVVQRWRKDGNDSFLEIVCNGVALTEKDAENPRRDGQYPFAEGGFEPIDAHYFMRASLTKKLQKEQDEGDHLWRAYINMTELQNKPPLGTNRPELTAVDIIIPGNSVYVGEGENFKVQPIIPRLESGFGTGGVNLLNALMQNMDASSVDPQQQGLGGGSGTATEAAITAQQADVMMGMFGRELSFLHRDWLRLRCQTAIWRVTEDEDMSQITIQDRLLKTGKTGKRKYKMEAGLSGMLKSAKEGAGQMRDMLLKKSFDMRNETKKADGKAETMLIDPEDLLNLEVYVYTDGEPQPKRTGALAKAMAMEDWAVYSAAPQVFNLKEAAEDLVKARGGDPTRLILDEGQAAGAMEGMGVPPAGPMTAPAPSTSQPTGPSKSLTGGIKRLMGGTRLAGQ